MAASFHTFLGNTDLLAILWGKGPSEHLGRAYLFSGPKGVGKKTAALLFAKHVLNLVETGGPEEEVGILHPDFLLIKPQRNGQEKAFISIEKARDLRRFLSQKPFAGEAKVVLIDQAECLRSEAANTLLKALEEPPSFALIILCVENMFQLLSTIRSRSIPIRFLRVPDASLHKALLARGIDDGIIDDILPLAGGLPGRALLLAQEKGLLQNFLKHHELAVSFLGISFVERLAAVAELKRNGGEMLREASALWISALRPVALLGEKKAVTLLEQLLRADELLQRTNVSPDLLLDRALVGAR